MLIAALLVFAGCRKRCIPRTFKVMSGACLRASSIRRGLPARLSGCGSAWKVLDSGGWLHAKIGLVLLLSAVMPIWPARVATFVRDRPKIRQALA